MTIDELYELVLRQDPEAKREGREITSRGTLYLSALTALPDGVSLSAGGTLYLSALTALPEGVRLTACGSLYLSALTALPEGVSLSAGGSLYLPALTVLPAGVSIRAGGTLYLRNLTALPEDARLSAEWSLYLPSLTVLPEGVSLSAGRSLELGSLQSEHQVYQGRRIRLRTVDGTTMRLISSRTLADGITLWQAQYFRGHLDTDQGCFVAQRGDFCAHGKTAEQAVRDLRFKEAVVASAYGGARFAELMGER
jgi:hypothetical protein